MALRGVKGQGPFLSETSAPQRQATCAFRGFKESEKQLAQPQKGNANLHCLPGMENPPTADAVPPPFQGGNI